MTGDTYYRRRISRQQIDVLIQYMERYPSLALATARSRESHTQSKRLWEKIARTLNRIDQSQPKSGSSWARYWIDLKFKARKKYTTLQKCQREGLHGAVLLSPLEERIVKILTDDEGNLLLTGPAYRMKGFHPISFMKEDENTHISLKSTSDIDTKIDDSGGLNDTIDDQDDFFNISERQTEHVTLPDSSDIKPNLNGFSDTDPIQIQDEKKTVEDLKKELVEFELRRQKELFEMEKQQRMEKHEMEMSILRIKKQILVKELKKL